MEDYLRLTLCAVGIIIVSFILFDYFFKRQRLKTFEKKQPFDMSIIENTTALKEPVKEKVVPVTVTSTADSTPSHIIVLSVFAKQGLRFASYDLLQAISATGMKFGEMNIFHYYIVSREGQKPIFSLASATKPGTFNLDTMGNFSCAGLTLFMDLKTATQPEVAFAKMLRTAEQLAEDLDGELRAGPFVKWTDETLRLYQRRIAEFHQTPAEKELTT